MGAFIFPVCPPTRASVTSVLSRGRAMVNIHTMQLRNRKSEIGFTLLARIGVIRLFIFRCRAEAEALDLSAGSERLSAQFEEHTPPYKSSSARARAAFLECCHGANFGRPT